MNKTIIKAVIITAISLVIFIILGLFVLGYLKPRPSGLLVVSDKTTEVYVDGQMVGKTPFEGTYLKKKKLNVRMLSENGNEYETVIPLVEGIKSVISHNFDENIDKVSGYEVFFEVIDSKETGLSISTVPDSAQIFVDGAPKGFAPFATSNISASEHQILIKSDGYKDLEIVAKILEGYRLEISAQLAKNIEEKSKVQGESVEVRIYVLILDTPTGYLRVRTEPGQEGSEIHQVKPGEKYPFLEEDANTGWFKIQLQPPAPGLPDGLVGWVSNEYSQKMEE